MDCINMFVLLYSYQLVLASEISMTCSPVVPCVVPYSLLSVTFTHLSEYHLEPE